MTDRRIDPVDLDRRLRDGFDALARETGTPPPLPSATRVPAARVPVASTDRGRRMLAVAAALVLVGLVAGGLASAVRDGDDGNDGASTRVDTEPAPDRPVIGTRWWLVSAQQDGTVVPLEGADPIELQVTERSVDADAPCLGVERLAEVRAPARGPGPVIIELSGFLGPVITIGCASAPLHDLVHEVFAEGSISVEVSGDRLTVTRGGALLTYEASDLPFGPEGEAHGTVVDRGVVEGVSYRLLWTGGALDLRTVRAADGSMPGFYGLGEDVGSINATRIEIGGRPYLFGLVPIDSARVVYESDEGTPQELEIHDVGSSTSAAVAEFVDGDPPIWSVTAYDSAGRELARLDWG